MALLHAWRRYGHGKIIGVPHATTVFWHLNNYDDIRIINSSDTLAKPFPDFLAINGPMAEGSFVRAGIPIEKLLKVEALRYQYLNKLDSKNARKNYNKTEVDKISVGSYKLLVLGDASFSQTVKMMNCVKVASLVKGVNFHITLKPHPASKFSFKDCADLDFDIIEMPLESVVKDFEGAFVGNSTSAAIEVLLLGLAVVIFLEDDDFNHSPMRGDSSVFFAGSGLQLLNALSSYRFVTLPHKKENFFWLDEKMPRWCDILLNKYYR
jgi:surface carbohydrate biosynthesis protein (TIGR04326 family)